MGLFSLVIALSLAEVGQKKKKLSLSHRKKARFMVIKLLGFKMMYPYQNVKFFGFTLLDILNSAVHYVRRNVVNGLFYQVQSTLSNEDDFIFNFLSS